jgi:hypothetical protein
VKEVLLVKLDENFKKRRFDRRLEFPPCAQRPPRAQSEKYDMGCLLGKCKEEVAESNHSPIQAEQVTQPAQAMSSSEEDEDPRFGEVIQAVWQLFLGDWQLFLSDHLLMVVFQVNRAMKGVKGREISLEELQRCQLHPFTDRHPDCQLIGSVCLCRDRHRQETDLWVKISGNIFDITALANGSKRHPASSAST